MNKITVESLTNSILSVFGDMDRPDVWRKYVAAVAAKYGSHPLCAAHTEVVSASFAEKWYAAFGI